MKREYLLIIFLLIPLVIAQPQLEIQKIDKGSTVIAELNNDARYDFIIDNKESSDNFEIYSLVGVAMSPQGLFELPHGNTTLKVLASPRQNVREENIGFFNFEYQLKGRNSGIFKDFLLIKIVRFTEALEVSALPLHPDDSEAVVILKNKQNTYIEAILNFESHFFSSEKFISLAPFEEARISIPVQKKEGNLSAGPYFIKVGVPNNEKAKIEGIIQYLEKEGTSIQKTTEGFIIKKHSVKKTNEGNTPIQTKVEIKKGIISRLFTINSPNPDEIERRGLSVYYVWNTSLSPGESFTAQSTTNYTFPFILLILIVLTALFVKTYSLTVLILQKNVSFVRTRGGEFALKVNIRLKARKHVDKIQLIDTLPKMAKLYEKFGYKPDKIDLNSGRLFWNIDRLSKGESRVFSYIIYSKMNIVGRFQLPTATAIFESDGKTQEVFSNKAFFAAEI